MAQLARVQSESSRIRAVLLDTVPEGTRQSITQERRASVALHSTSTIGLKRWLRAYGGPGRRLQLRNIS